MPAVHPAVALATTAARASSAPAQGPAAARTVRRGPWSRARTTSPTASAATPARLIVAAAPASSPVAATAGATDRGAWTSRPSTTRATGTSTAAAAFG
jgi:hypothetical protein